MSNRDTCGSTSTIIVNRIYIGSVQRTTAPALIPVAAAAFVNGGHRERVLLASDIGDMSGQNANTR